MAKSRCAGNNRGQGTYAGMHEDRAPWKESDRAFSLNRISQIVSLFSGILSILIVVGPVTVELVLNLFDSPYKGPATSISERSEEIDDNKIQECNEALIKG